MTASLLQTCKVTLWWLILFLFYGGLLSMDHHAITIRNLLPINKNTSKDQFTIPNLVDM